MSSSRKIYQQERESWEREFKDRYEEMWFKPFHKDFLSTLLTCLDPSVKKILISGCGPQTSLQECIITNFQNVEEVVCNDYCESAINLARTNYSHPKVKYLLKPTEDLSYYRNYFDAVLVVNSILSSDHELNIRALEEIYRTLKLGGQLIAIFPTVFCACELVYMRLNGHQELSKWREKNWINLENSSFYDSEQGIWKTGYTPNQLNSILKKIGFKRERMEIYFFDNDYFVEQAEIVHGIPKDGDSCIWELLAILRKGK